MQRSKDCERWIGSQALIYFRERAYMSQLEKIESQLKELSPKELAVFREWLAQFDAEVWDRQFEADVKSGKLDNLAECALRDHDAGRSTDL